jgi:AcrR family transcriptional regulator
VASVVEVPARAYHHGDLRRALVKAAVEEIAAAGPATVSLRALARRVGVSHAAPAYHFGDKAGLLTAVAAEGYRRQAETLEAAYAATGSFLEVGVAYVRFAVTEPAYFDVMHRPDLYHRDDPELVTARAAAAAVLYRHVDDAAPAGPAEDTRAAGVAAWSLVHGLAVLWRSGSLPADLGDDPEPVARACAAYLFGGRRAPTAS